MLQKILSNTLYKKFLSIICVLLLWGITNQAYTQQLRWNVTIDHSQYNTQADKSIFAQMKADIERFVNNRQWTEDEYEVGEQITCNLMLQIQKESSLTEFYCNAQIQSSRPVYNAAYETVLLNYADRFFYFIYQPGMQIEYNDNAYSSELSSLMAFYSYIILGMDYDSFGLNSGKPFYLLANQALNNNTVGLENPGWKNDANSKFIYNRFWLIENLLNTQMLDFHTTLYNYHRLGLDLASQKSKELQSSVMESLKILDKIREVNNLAVLIPTYMLAKRDEFIKIMKKAPFEKRKEAVALMTLLDPAYSQKYSELMN